MARKLTDDETWIFIDSPEAPNLCEGAETETFLRNLAEKRDHRFDFADKDVWLGPLPLKSAQS